MWKYRERVARRPGREQTEPTVATYVELPESLNRQLRVFAAEQRTALRYVVEDALRAYLPPSDPPSTTGDPRTKRAVKP